jgi:hypothetical protein
MNFSLLSLVAAGFSMAWRLVSSSAGAAVFHRESKSIEPRPHLKFK